MAEDAAMGRSSSNKTRLGRKMRRASFILPKTGERSKRHFTLRDASQRAINNNDNDEDEPSSNSSSNVSWSGRDRTYLQVVRQACVTRFQRAWAFACSPTGQGIFKCSIGYLLGSLATFVPALAYLFGNKQDSKHMVATVMVYFHPARTLGSMLEATLIGLIAFLYAALISGGSMALSILFANYDLLALGHAIVLIVFVAGGFGFMAFVKQYMGNPIVNVGTSLASLATINILIREGSVQSGVFSMYKVTQNLGMTLVGIAIAFVVNITVLPVLARKKLSIEMEKNTDLLGEMLISITRAFLHGREEDLEDDYYKSLEKDHRISLNSMKKNLNEAKKEHYVLGSKRIYTVEARIVQCLNGLHQDLGGLRSAAYAQFAFLNEQQQSISGAYDTSGARAFTASPTTQSYFTSLAIIDESPAERGNLANGPTRSPDETMASNSTRELSQRYTIESPVEPGTVTPVSVKSFPELASSQTRADINANIAKSPGDMFVAFISQLGPPTKSLVFTLKQILDELPFKIGSTSWNPWALRELEVAVNEQFHASLREAIDMYRESRKGALTALHQNRAINAAINAQHGTKSTFSIKTPDGPNLRSPAGSSVPGQPPKHSNTLFNRHPEEVLADIEEVSACCGHFSFALLDFAEDVLSYLDILDDLKAEIESPKRTWNWLIPWRRRGPSKTAGFRKNIWPESNDEPDASFAIPDPIKKADAFADPERAARGKPWYYNIYRAFRFLRRDDVRFAIKIGSGAGLYALPAFLEETRPFFLFWRGEWGFVSYMVVCCMTVGASNTTGFNRIYGSCIGALAAVVVWIISNHEGVANPFILAFLGWLMSLVGFYIIVAQDNGPMGRFIFLSYNLVALYAYSVSIHDDDNDDDEGGIDPAIWSIALHRVVGVSAGTIWAIIVCRWIAPISARAKLREGICILWLRMGLIWKRDPLAMFLLGEPRTSYMDIREESELQSFLGRLRGMRKSANAEFEFQGPFPDQPVSRILDRTGRMLDAFHAMNVVICKNLRYTEGEAAVLRYTRPERFALSARISHLFTVLASSVKLEYPLTDELPEIDHSRDRLLARISEYRMTATGRELTTEQDYELLYAYVLVTGQLGQDIRAVSAEIETLFGTLNEENLKLH